MWVGMVERGTYMYACAWCILYWAVFYLYKRGTEMDFGKNLGKTKYLSLKYVRAFQSQDYCHYLQIKSHLLFYVQIFALIMQAAHALLENPDEPVSELTYYGCIDATTENIKVQI